MNIEIHQVESRDYLLEYKSDLIPQIGDWYAGSEFKDGHQRTIVNRLITPGAPNYLNVYVTYTYPQLVDKEKLTDTERDLLTQQHLS